MKFTMFEYFVKLFFFLTQIYKLRAVQRSFEAATLPYYLKPKIS